MHVILDDAPDAHRPPWLAPEEVPPEGPLALTIDAWAAAASLAPLLPRAVAIRIAFAGFADGRGFSLGRQLRALGYVGRLRAAGPLLPDQRAALTGCGFDEVELTPAHLARTGPAVWAAPAAPPPFAARRAAQA